MKWKKSSRLLMRVKEILKNVSEYETSLKSLKESAGGLKNPEQVRKSLKET